ncbi:MAG: undecaprenyl-phosphate galactose phosphotransferase WbaP [Bacteroidetes bacterium]|jgi:Undecaprenyl-phosphate galactose phosphotransferase WbaP|nr:undecaprenyl-phosphate galactose phosphotransferase WbaP [Bacteroidota bacterium]
MEARLYPTFDGIVAAPPRAQVAPRVTGMPRVGVYRWATALSFFLTDVVALLLVTGMTLLVGDVVDARVSIGVLLPAYGGLVGAYVLFGLYQPVGMHPAQELRTASVVALVVFTVYYAAMHLWMEAEPKLANDLLMAGGVAVVVLPIVRALARVLLARASWWGVPTVVIASEEAGRRVLWTLRRWPELGFKPIALLYDDESYADIEGIRVLRGTRAAPMLASTYGVPYAIVARPDLDGRQQAELIGRMSKFFRRVFVVPDMAKASALWTARSSSEGLIGYGVQHCTRNEVAGFAKRVMDVVMALVGGLLLLPLLIVLAVWIVLDSGRPVFYRQHRMGQDGRCFKVLKFRSMYVDAEERLQEILKRDPALRHEYAVYHKLRDDPRVTAVGRILRRYSLDELPQLWNVLRGDLSLVGPRAYMPGELGKMDGIERVILQNRPGITGLWQVSGRNALSFRERLEIDVHYVQNWTPWLDLYIIARTVPVVLRGEGAA